MRRAALRARLIRLPLMCAVLLGLFSGGSSIASAAGPAVTNPQPVQIIWQPVPGPTVADLGLNVFPEAINAGGQVTGYQLLSTGRVSAFSWKSGVIQNTPTGLGNYG